ncbi:hypothetical protein GWI33_013457 [Rhynchophorus ferrugineus]|uniref:Uncharacterized protein n=1 Tax=Rhynchophorus ferrugineus TaxID=354439 RepID=A0A834MD80_RHYFE|nr:hypothetical protein GWI33_013457 [Rhynchophorus ferrugineus]
MPLSVYRYYADTLHSFEILDSLDQNRKEYKDVAGNTNPRSETVKSSAFDTVHVGASKSDAREFQLKRRGGDDDRIRSG